jgi:hypothetical protein
MLPEYEPDLNWFYRDSADHKHVWFENEVPTTYLAIVDWATCCEVCNEATPILERRCRLCDEKVEPGMILKTPAGSVRTVPGLWEATLTVTYGDFIWTFSLSKEDVEKLRKGGEAEVKRFVGQRQPDSVTQLMRGYLDNRP